MDLLGGFECIHFICLTLMDILGRMQGSHENKCQLQPSKEGRAESLSHIGKEGAAKDGR